MRRLGIFVQPYWRRMAVAMALLLGAALAELAPPYLTRVAIDGPIAAHDVGGVLPIVLLDVGALLLAFACRYGQTYIMQATGQRVMVDIRMRIFSHIQHMSLSFFDRNPVGRLITRLTNDVDALNEFLTQGMVALLGDSARLVFIVIAMLVINWRLALISLMMLPLVILATMFFQRAMRASERIFRILDTPEDVSDSAEPRALPQPVRGDVQFKDVWFSYASESVVTRPLSVAEDQRPTTNDQKEPRTENHPEGTRP